MSTQSPSSIEQTSSLLHRLVKHLMTFLEVEEITNKRDLVMYHSNSPLNQLILDLQILVKMLIKKIQDEQKGFEQQLQKLQEKLRKHAKNQCEMKLYTDYLQDELKSAQKEVQRLESSQKLLQIQFNKQLETLKTEFSHGTTSKYNQHQKNLETARPSIKATDPLSKIKLKLMNLGNIQVDEPQSCMNTLRKSIPCQPEQLRPLSEPNSYRNSPTHQQNQKKSSKSKSKANLHSKHQKSKSKSKINNLHIKTDETKKTTKSKPKLKKL